MEFWDMKSNLKNKPTLKNRTIIVLEHISKKYNIAIGLAIEKIFLKEIDFDKETEEFKETGTIGF